VISAWLAQVTRRVECGSVRELSTSSVGGESEVADANQSLGQNVDQESAQKLFCGNRHDLLFATMRIILPAKRDSIILEGDESMVGDRDAMV